MKATRWRSMSGRRLTDTIVINSCDVTARPCGRRVRPCARRAATIERPHHRDRLRAQTDPGSFDSRTRFDHVIGNDVKMQPATFAALAQESGERHRQRHHVRTRNRHHLVTGFGGRARAYVQIQNGCDLAAPSVLFPMGG